MADPFSSADIDRLKPLFKTPPRPNVLGTPAGLEALEAEKSGLASFLGKTDYAAQNKEATDLARLQMAMSLMGRGFAAMGAAPQPGESPIGALGRTLIAPVAGDITTIAGPLMKQRAAAKLAEQAEERQIKLSALQSVRSRQDQQHAAEVAATNQARALALKMNQGKTTLSNDYTVNGENIPVIVKYNWDGTLEGFYDTDNEKLDRKALKIWRKTPAAIKPFVATINDAYVKKVGTDGETVWVSAPAAIRVASPDGLTSVARNETTILDFTPGTGNAVILKPGSKKSIYEPSKSEEVFATARLTSLLGLPDKDKGRKITRNTYTPKGDAPAGTRAFSTFTIGGATYDPRRMVDDIDGKTVRTYNADDQTVSKRGDVYNLSELTTRTDPAAGAEVKVGPHYGQPVLENGKLGPPTPYTLVQSRSVKDGKLVFKDSYYMQDPGGTGRLVDAPKMRLVDDRHEGFTDAGAITALAASGGVGAGDTVQVQRAAARQGTGEKDLWRYVYRGKQIELTDTELKNFQDRPLDERQKLNLGQTTRFNEKGSDLTVTAAKLAETRKIPGLEGVAEGDVVEVWQTPTVAGETPTVQHRYQGRVIKLTPKQAVLLGTGTAPDLVDYVNVTGGVVTVKGIKVPPGKSVQLSQRAFAALPQQMRGALSDNAVKQARAIKKADFRAAWQTVRGNNPQLHTTFNEKPSEQQLASLFARFPGVRSGENLNKAIFDMLRLQIAPTGDGTNLPGANWFRTGDGDEKTPANKAEESQYDFAVATEDKLNKAGIRYKALRERELVRDEPWGSLSYIEKQAFASIPPKGIRPGKVPEQLAGALKVLSDRRDKFKNPSPGERVAFAAAIRAIHILKSIKKGGDLNQTGVLEGVFSRLGATTLADWSPLTSTESSRLNQALTDLSSSLKTISSSEGTDGKPSNYRLQLQQNVVPAFSKSQEVNERNIETLISKLEGSIRSHFSTSLSSDRVIPQSYVRMAREAGIKDVKVDARNYPWINPKIALEESLPVTKEGTLRALGLVKYSAKDVQALYPGTILPPDDNGRIWKKVSLTHIQEVVRGNLKGRKWSIQKQFK